MSVPPLTIGESFLFLARLDFHGIEKWVGLSLQRVGCEQAVAAIWQVGEGVAFSGALSETEWSVLASGDWLKVPRALTWAEVPLLWLDQPSGFLL